MRSIFAGVPWTEIGHKIRAETKNRESHEPFVSIYRWWARRPHALIASILKSAAKELPRRSLMADPFSGGGTTALEGLRHSFRIYAQDVNPWAAWGLHVGLSPIDADDLLAAGHEFLRRLRLTCLEKYQPGLAETHVHTFRVRVGRCATCSEQRWWFPYSLITKASRSAMESDGYFGCRICGQVTRHSLNAPRPRCPACNVTYSAGKRSKCGKAGCTPEMGNGPIAWRVVLIQRLLSADKKSEIEFINPRDCDLLKADCVDALCVPAALQTRIPIGLETARLHKFGFSTWADLYPRRQLAVLLEADRVLRRMNLDEGIYRRLALCVAGSVEMPGHVCRWDRFHPKVFECLANHRYSLDGLAVESNPLSKIGRGCLAHRIAASAKAARCLAKICPSDFKPVYSRVGSKRHPQESATANIVQGSSERLRLKDRSVDLVLTDPPYYDCVQYGELSSLFLSWSKVMGIARDAGVFERLREVVPNRCRNVGQDAYRRKLTKVFRECARSLRDEGRLILTYHCRNLRAWSALGRAIYDAGFRIVSLAVSETENGTDQAKRGKNSFLSDLLVECSKSDSVKAVRVFGRAKTPEQRELLHVGHTLAEVGSGRYFEFRAAFLRRVSRMKHIKIWSPMS